MKRLYLLVLYLASTIAAAQNSYTIKGKVTDFVTHDPVPFASISLKNTTIGKNTDFEGNFVLILPALNSDSLLVSCMGYASKTVFIRRDSLSQTVNIQLKPTEILLHEITVHAGENPAWAIIRKAVAAKSENNFKKLSAFDYKSYNKIEVDINNITDKLRKRKLAQKVNKAIEELGTLTDDEGKALVPTFISESVSHYYFRNDPRLSKEIIEKTNIKGIGVTDGSLTSQLIGSTFQQYNFYVNQVDILNKTFASPIADDWRLVYDYYLADSTYLGDDFCYRIEFTPKRKQDLAFAGTMWIHKGTWGIVQIDAAISKDANLNFVERIKIQQELEPVDNIWMPVKNRILVDVSEVTKGSAGLLLKFTNYNEDIVLNRPKDVKFYASGIEISPDYRETDNKYWQSVRPEPFTRDEQLAYTMIDTIKTIPAIKNYTEIAKILTSGYTRLFTGIELGSLVYTGAINDVEGVRLRLGLRTNYEFSRKWVLEGYLAYGTKDEEWKMSGEVTRIFSRKPWTTMSMKVSHDIEQVGLRKEDLGLGPIFSAYMRFFTLNRPYYENENRIQFQREVSKGVFTSFGVRTRSFDPLYNFQYRSLPHMGDTSPLTTRFNTSELLSEITFARDELAVINDNERLSFGTVKSPTITFKYTLGAKNILNSDFNYHNLMAKFSHTLNLGYFGKTYYRAEAGAIFGTVPYPLLKSHLGNESIFIVSNSFNLMNIFEFVSDRYATVRYNHDFEGLLFNRFPLIKKWKWRTFTTGKFLWGTLSDKNYSITPPNSDAGFRNFSGLGKAPYIELGYGVSNIFKFFRVEAMHRLTYLDKPDVQRFGVKVSAEITL
ncbi:DUF5686 and carboxypeptidase-like regulatory domain-containing protein [Emticicia sp. 21SJ11W-3]|uniref:DUF5686 and carboxypeptidase-like regulatory domain-containing protein n=1 Tax=Emticicia sp. 21SJ11W-3 TaxID=2916755 RepID=UPI00209D92BC|nr:DUF5686 and carboxypeptidase-like regulatory domain-containing protein [Emticicia sp. 21SJ11W-3]UTA70324.1 DUF5686 and carboxypeptidase regulatory-like domain-containing protein [Emticicia sp. 21SJ11W-3]